MSDYICREALKDVFEEDGHLSAYVEEMIDSIPAADVVSRGAYDQTDWERCVALTQLKEIGKGLGERMDDVRPVVLCRDCIFRSNEWTGCPKLNGTITGDEFFCKCGIKREEN